MEAVVVVGADTVEVGEGVDTELAGLVVMEVEEGAEVDMVAEVVADTEEGGGVAAVLAVAVVAAGAGGALPTKFSLTTRCSYRDCRPMSQRMTFPSSSDLSEPSN